MKRFSAVIVLLISILVSCKQKIEVEIQSRQELPGEDNCSIYLSGIGNVYLDEDTALAVESSGITTKASVFNASISEAGITHMERIFPYSGEFEERSRKMGLHRWYRVYFSQEIKSDEATETLKSIKGIQAYEPLIKTKTLGIPFNDPGFSSQWQYWNDGSKAGWVAGADMQVLPVWAHYTKGNPNVIIAVVDSGIQLDHEDLASNVDAGNSYNFADNTPNITPGDHGTHVAGSIAAVNNNGIGVSGMAGGDFNNGIPGCKLISCEVFSDSKSGGFESAIKWAADHGAVLCNNSWGYDFVDSDNNYDAEKSQQMHDFYLQPNSGNYTSALKSAIDYFNKYAGIDANGVQVGPMAGGVCFFSAGNDGRECGAPAGYPGVVAVGAIGPHGGRAYYSNYGDWVDISATGGDYHYAQITSTLPGNEYGTMQGTSMSCPHVTGMAGLLVSYFGKDGFTRDDLLEKMLNSGNPIVTLNNLHIGRMADTYAAITYGQDLTPSIITDLNGSPKSNKVNLSWTLTGSGYNPAAGYVIFSGTDKAAVESSTPYQPGSGVRKDMIVTTDYEVGDTFIYTTKALNFETVYWYKVFGFDKQLNYSEPSSVISVVTPANNPPEVTPSEDVTDLTLKSFNVKTVSFTVKDPDEHNFDVTITPGSDAETWTSNMNEYIVNINASKVKEGTYTALIKSTDVYDCSSVYEFKYTILPNNTPVALKEIQDIILEGITSSFELSVKDYFTDPDGEDLVYETANSSPSILHANVTAGVMRITPINYGLSTITLSAKDARGEKALIIFKVLVQKEGIKYHAYPNPVKDYLYITNNETNLISMYIMIVSSSGNTVYKGNTEASAFEPAVIDMSSFAPGQYMAIISFGGNTYKKTIIKQ